MSVSSLLLQSLAIIFVLIIYVNGLTTYRPVIPGFESCHFQNKTYRIGSKFHPLVKINNSTYEAVCTICTCNPTTLAQCTQVVCPKLNCSDPIQLSGECCPKCLDEEVKLVSQQSCIVGKLIYQHGAVFHPSSTETNVTNPYCIRCECNNGTVQCTDVSSSCSKPTGCAEADQYIEKGHCCKVCPTPDVSKGECVDESNHIRKNKESWQPSFNGFIATCINCTCMNSSVSCERLPCPPVPPCEPGVVETYVLCCPKCSRNTSTTTTSATTSTSTPPPPVVPSLTTSPEPTCDTSKYTHKVYLCNETLAMAIEDTRNDTVQLYHWLNGGVKDVHCLSSKAFYYSSCVKNYVGRALERRVAGLTNKESKRKKIENCTKKCAKLVVTMLRPVPDNELCSN